MLDCYYPSQLLRSCFISFLKPFREGQFICCCGISFHIKAPVNWKLFFINSNHGLGRCKPGLFLVEKLQTFDLLVNLPCKFSGHLLLRILYFMTNLSYFINFLRGNQSQTLLFLCFPFSISFLALDCNFCRVSSLVSEMQPYNMLPYFRWRAISARYTAASFDWGRMSFSL